MLATLVSILLLGEFLIMYLNVLGKGKGTLTARKIFQNYI